MKSYAVHYRNKYPGGMVQLSESALDVYDKNGDHVVALRKDGAGMWVDKSEEFGCKDRHDLSPIPKASRVFKVRDGKIALDEEAEDRIAAVAKGDLLVEGRKVMSEVELAKAQKERA